MPAKENGPVKLALPARRSARRLLLRRVRTGGTVGLIDQWENNSGLRLTRRWTGP